MARRPIGRVAASALAALLLLGAGAKGGARGESEEPAWKPCKAVEGPQVGLLDARSLTVEHERKITMGTSWGLDGHGLRFELHADGRLRLWHTKPGAKPPASPRTLREAPVLVMLDAFERKYAVSVRPAQDASSVWIASACGVEFTIGRRKAYLVDSDLDGRLGGPGDGYVAPGSRTVGPWVAQAWSRETALELRRTEEGSWQGRPISLPYPQDADHSAAWRTLQWTRQQCGVLPVGYKASLEHGIRLHGEYCIQNGYRGHVQERGKKAYTPEGAVAGRQSVLGYGIATLLAGMVQQLGTLYHRNGLLQPALTHTAMALHRGVFGANVRDSTGGPLQDCLIVVPPHGMQQVPRQFSPGGETPMPVRGRLAGMAQLGTSVGVFSRSLEQARELREKPKLSVTRLVGSRREHGPAFRLDLYYPGHTPHAGVHESNFGNVALTPPRPLEPRTTYLCSIRVALPHGTRTTLPPMDPFVYEWEFETGK